MKHLFSIILIFKFLTLSAQVEFAPVGATWYFDNLLSSGIPNLTWDASKFECTGTKDIQGKTCKEIKGVGAFFQDGEKIFYFDEVKQKFRLIYNFAAKKGDTWILYPWKVNINTFLKDSSQIKIDSVYTTVIAGVSRKVQNVSIKKLMVNGGNSVLWGLKNIEGIGNTFFILPGYGCCEFPYVGLRCYESNGQKFSTLKPNELCDKQVWFTKTDDAQKVNVFFSLDKQNAFLKVESETFQKGIFNLYDTQGNLAATYPLLQNHDEYRFDISNLANGMYFWHLVLDDKVRQTGKVVVIKE